MGTTTGMLGFVETLTATERVVFTCPPRSAVKISSLIVAVPSASTIFVRVVPAGASAGTGPFIINGLNAAAGSVTTFSGLSLSAGQSIHARNSGGASISIFGSIVTGSSL